MKEKRPHSVWLWALPLAFLTLFYFYPMGSILAVGFERSETGLLGALSTALTSPRVQGVLSFTFWQASISTWVTLIVGLPGAYLFARFTFPGKKLLRALIGVPFVLPTLVVATAFSALLGPRGWVNLGLMALFDLTAPPLEFINTFGAILLAHVFYNTTIIIRMVGDFWGHLDTELVQAARMLGASRWRAWREVTLPLLWPPILAASLLVFIFNFTSFGVILVLGGPAFSTLEVEIFYQTISLFNLPMAASLSLIQLVATLILTITYSRLSHDLVRPLRLRPQAATAQRLSSWRQRVLAGGLILGLLILFVSPLAGLAARSLSRLEPDRGQRTVEQGLTLDFYRELGINRRDSMFYASPMVAIGTSLQYAGGTVLLALILGAPTAWLLAQGEHGLMAKVVDPLLMLPLGTSAVTLGLGFIVAFDTPPVNWRASSFLIPLAHTLVAFPFVVRSLVPALRSVQPQLREAAKALGAKPTQVWRYVDLPLVGRALLGAAIFAFTISMGEFGATALVGRPEYPTIPVMIYRLLGTPGGLNYGQAMALSTILMMVTAGGMLFIERLRIDAIGEF